MNDSRVKYIVQPIGIDQDNPTWLIKIQGSSNAVSFEPGYGFINKEDAIEHYEHLNSKGINAVLVDVDAVMQEFGKELAQNVVNEKVKEMQNIK